MDKKYIIALDQGTTSSRAIVFDSEQQIVGVAQKEFTQIYPKEGWVEHDAMEIWSSQSGVLAEVIARTGISQHDIIGIGITGCKFALAAVFRVLRVVDRRGINRVAQGDFDLCAILLLRENNQRGGHSACIGGNLPGQLLRFCPFRFPRCGIECSLQCECIDGVLKVTERRNAFARQEIQYDEAHAMTEPELHVGFRRAAGGPGEEEVVFRLPRGCLVVGVCGDLACRGAFTACIGIVGGEIDGVGVLEVDAARCSAVRGEYAVGCRGGEFYIPVLRRSRLSGYADGVAVRPYRTCRTGSHRVDDGSDPCLHEGMVCRACILFLTSSEEGGCCCHEGNESDLIDCFHASACIYFYMLLFGYIFASTSSPLPLPEVQSMIVPFGSAPTGAKRLPVTSSGVSLSALKSRRRSVTSAMVVIW